MRLTRRQEDFIRKLVDVYRDPEEPVHYADLARLLDVSKYTAYYMLRLLEDRQYVEAVYEHSGEGPGRSRVRYRPSERARETFQALSTGASEDWNSIKKQILHHLTEGNFEDQDIADAILARLPAPLEDDVDYCASLVGALAIRLRTRARHQVLAYYLSTIMNIAERMSTKSLRMFPSFLLGLTATEDDEPESVLRLMESVRRYEQVVDSMDQKTRDRLANLLGKILAPLQPRKPANLKPSGE